MLINTKILTKINILPEGAGKIKNINSKTRIIVIANCLRLITTDSSYK